MGSVQEIIILRVSNGVSPIFLVFQASTRVSMGRADVPSAGLGWREKRQPSTMLRPGGLSASTARFYGDATGVASLQEVAWIQRVPSDQVPGQRREEQ